MTVYRSPAAAFAVHSSGWHRLPSGAEITCLPIVEHDNLFAHTGHGPAAAWCSTHGYRLPSKAEYEELHRASLRITPYTLPTMDMLVADKVPRPWTRTDGSDSPALRAYRAAHMSSRAWCELHDAEVWRRLYTAGWVAGPVANAGKHWGEGGYIVGWWITQAGALIQDWSAAHVNQPDHTDYATTFHACREPKTVTNGGGGGGHRTLRLTSPLMRGDDVRAAQRAIGVADDSLFGPATERAVRAFQRGHGMLDDGIVGPRTWAAIDSDKVADTERAPGYGVVPLDCPFLQARHYTRAARSAGDIRWIVLHSTENPIAPGVARAIARWFEGESAPRASAHYVVGPEETWQCVQLEDVAWAAPGANRAGIQIEQVGQALKTGWLGEGLPVLRRSAEIVAALCRSYQIPVQRVDAAGLLAGTRGITTHAMVTRAFKRSDHVDPGGPDDRLWPWDEYLTMVRTA